ncbi:MAG: trypsin-like peptidase domain-containing protein [Candidatus Moraniibacteriota bacterium]
MEDEIISPVESAKAVGTGPASPASHRPVGASFSSKAAFFFAVIVFSFVAGIAGSMFERRLPEYVAKVPFLSSFLKQKQAVIADAGMKTGTSLATPTDPSDVALVGIVERSSASVVSVVASKDVAQVGNPSDLPSILRQFGFDVGNGGTDGQAQGNAGATPQKQKIGSGTGFFVSADGLVVTNKHVVSDETAEYTVVVPGGKEYPAKVLARSPNQDIAVLKIDGTGFTPIPIGDSASLQVGQTAIAIGNPLGEFPNSVSRGIISGLNRNLTAGSEFGDSETLSDIIQTDAAINPGNSGGPLLDLSGNVIGINVAMAQNAEGIGFAIPINQVKRVIDDVKTTGKISTPYIGVRYATVDETVQKANNLPYAYGAIVVRGVKATDLAVIPGSPADKAGIVENDIILEVDGTKLDADHPLGNIVANHRVGDTLSLKVWHKGAEGTVSVTLTERPQA